MPVLASAFVAPGLAAAVNVGRGDDRTAIAGAVGYGTTGERIGFVLGVGSASPPPAGYGGSRFVYGVRASMTVVRFADERLALTPFIGFGSSQSTVSDTVAAGLSGRGIAPGTSVRMDRVPIGVSAGWRFAVGTQRAVALSVAPMYALSRRSAGDSSASSGRLRFATVADVALTTRFGLTLGTEFGQTTATSSMGPRGVSVGGALSYSVGHR